MNRFDVKDGNLQKLVSSVKPLEGISENLKYLCYISDLASIGALPTEAGDGLEDLDTYSP